MTSALINTQLCMHQVLERIQSLVTVEYTVLDYVIFI